MQDHQAILVVLADYFTGLYTGDTDLLRTVFHPQAALFADLRGQPYYKRVEDYLEAVELRAAPQERNEPYQMRVLSLNVTHNIATAKVHVPALGFNYVNYLSLVRMDGAWVIVSKVFADVPQASAKVPAAPM